MSEFLLQPDIYASGSNKNLVEILENIWIKNIYPDDGDFYLLSGFGNYNGGVRFFQAFQNNVINGKKVIAVFGGKANFRQTSKQLIKRLLQCGCEVWIVNRRKLFHSKCYGVGNADENNLVITSGNFTGPGMTENVESSVWLEPSITKMINFSWKELIEKIQLQNWDIRKPTLENRKDPAWHLLYDEYGEYDEGDYSQNYTMILTLGSADTARIMADRNTPAGLGSQYFWLSKDCYDFFPPLDILNQRGLKITNSCLIKLYYVDLDIMDENSRVTFEAGNNVDFRLGTGKLRYEKIANNGDIAALSRISFKNYELRIFKKESKDYNKLIPFAVRDIGNRGKKLGYIDNQKFKTITE